ncbi:hypothetical protein ACFOGG_16935 [Brenneria rubrifaciens]|uniref:hypothetical protein n=1 Tax=Brenneria rubrifaciens TaxID=55213 RepID=UPI00361FACEF
MTLSQILPQVPSFLAVAALRQPNTGKTGSGQDRNASDDGGWLPARKILSG